MSALLIVLVLMSIVLFDGSVQSEGVGGYKVENQIQSSANETLPLLERPSQVILLHDNWISRIIKKIRSYIVSLIDRVGWELHKRKLLKGVHEGMTETEVKDILGQPGHEGDEVAGQLMWGRAHLPVGTKYRSLNYFLDDRVYIHLVSPETYSNITGKKEYRDDWIVIQIDIIPGDID